MIFRFPVNCECFITTILSCEILTKDSMSCKITQHTCTVGRPFILAYGKTTHCHKPDKNVINMDQLQNDPKFQNSLLGGGMESTTC